MPHRRQLFLPPWRGKVRMGGLGCVITLLCLLLLLPGCSPSGDQVGDVSTPTAPSAQVEQQAIENLLDLYSEALLSEDIDRLQAVLASDAPGASTQTRTAATTFRQAVSDTFRSRTILAHALQDVVIADDHQSATGLEVQSSLDPEHLVQQTEVFRTTFTLVRQPEGEVIHFRIADVQRDGPLVEVTTPGLLVAGPPSPLTLRAAGGPFNLANAEVTNPEDNLVTSLDVTDQQASGTFIAQSGTGLHSLSIQARSTDGDLLRFTHHYRLHQTQEGIAQRVSGTQDTRFFAVTVTANGMVWAGGDQGARLYQIAPGARSAQQVGTLLADPGGRVQDLALDSLGRLHALVFSSQNSGDIVLDQGVFCQTINASAPDYPFEVLDLSASTLKPSPSTRLQPAPEGAVWLFGSDGGVAQVSDSFRQGACPDDGISVTYDPLYQRQSSGLPTNTVPAFIAAPDGTLWFGTALGLVRWQNGVFTPLPFQKSLTLPDDVETLEGLFQAIAQAIFDATPLATLTVGGLSVSDILGTTLSKEDFIFSAVQDPQGAIWAGTLGGGLRRIELIDGVPKDTLHLTRQDGLSSNLILSLALGPDQTLWVGTDEGVSRIDTAQAPPAITTLTALEGIPGPVRDIAIDPQGTVWLATDAGLFRLSARSGRNGDTQLVSAGRLIRVSGNNQSALPGQELPVPLVVRLEDRVGEPVANATLTAQVLAGEAMFVSGATLTTDAEGEAQFRLQLGGANDDVLVEVAAVDLDVPPVKFFATIGSVDIPNLPRDITVAEAVQVAFIADKNRGVPIVDVQNPAQPVLLHVDDPFYSGAGVHISLIEARATRLYLVTGGTVSFNILDISDPRAADFTRATLNRETPDVTLGKLIFPPEANRHLTRDFAISDTATFAYMVQTGETAADPGTLHVIDMRDETQPQLVTSLKLPNRQTSGVALLGDVTYVAADTSGLLVYDVHDPLQPVLLTTVAADPNPDDGIDLALTSRLTIDGDFAYVVQTEFDHNTRRQTDRLLVFDLQHRTAPRLRGSLALRVATAEPTTPSAFTGTGLAVSGGFAYLTRSALGLQVVDVRHPDAPRFVGFLSTPSQAVQLTTSGDLIYVVDSVFGVQVIQGPGTDLSDRDGDGVIDFFDRFPLDPAEFLDSDGDGVGDNADRDDDNDGFSDSQEQQASPQTDPLDQLSFPVTAPPAGITTLVVDAATTLPAAERNGTATAPYHSVSEALQVIRDGQAPQVDTVQIRAGTYAKLSTNERFPLDLSDLSQLTLQGADRDTTILDAEFVDDVITAERANHLTLDSVTLTHGVNGVEAFDSTFISLGHSRSTGHSSYGGSFDGVSDLVVQDNEMDHNGADGLRLRNGSTARIIGNTLHDNDDDGMSLSPTAHAEVTGNVVKNNANDGIKLFADSSAIITDNRIEDSGRHGVTLQESSTAELNGNTINRSSRFGIFLRAGATATMTDNHIGGGQFCILIWTGSAATMTHNTITGCQAGVAVLEESSAEIIDNTITSHMTAGVTVSSSSTATLAGNTLSDSPVGLLLQGKTSFATLRGGTITGSSYAAVSLIGGTTLDMSLDSPETLHIVDNSGVGVLVADDTSRVEFDSGRTHFEANGGGDIQGRGIIVDVADADTDGDGLLDSFERRYGFDPLTPGDGTADSDGDGLINVDEQLARTDPRLADTDGDGLSDGAEVTVHGTDPRRADTDIDGLSDGAEVQDHGTDPTLADSDGDGLGDGEETMLAGLDPLDAGDASVVVDLVSNGSFEADGGSLSGWTQVNRIFSIALPEGSWSVLHETTSALRHNQVPPAPDGNVAAIAESRAGDSVLVLRQEINIPPAASVVLGVDVLVLSGMPFATPESFDVVVSADSDLPQVNHQFRIDLLDPEAPELAVGDTVLAPLFRTEEGMSPIVNYRRLLFDLTPYAGRRVVLRFAHQQEPSVLLSGIDNVRLLATGVSP